MSVPFCEPILRSSVHNLSILDSSLDSLANRFRDRPVVAPRPFSYRIFFDAEFFRCVHESHTGNARALDDFPLDCDPTAMFPYCLLHCIVFHAAWVNATIFALLLVGTMFQ